MMIRDYAPIDNNFSTLHHRARMFRPIWGNIGPAITARSSVSDFSVAYNLPLEYDTHSKLAGTFFSIFEPNSAFSDPAKSETHSAEWRGRKIPTG